MQLEEYILSSPLWRDHSFPFILTDYIIICYSNEILHLREFKNFQTLENISRIAIINYGEDTPQEVKMRLHDGRERSIPTMPAAALAEHVNCEFVFFSHEYSYASFLQGQLFLLRNNVRSFHIVMPYSYNSGFKTTHLPGYYKKYRHELEDAFALLADEESRMVFAARIRALVTGNVGYLKISRYAQYFHPLAKPVEGDVVIDGGVSENVQEQIKIATCVGSTGAVIGFEPDPIGFCKAQEALSNSAIADRYFLVPLGLWNEKGTVQLQSGGVGSHVTEAQGDGVVSIDVTTVTDVIKENKLKGFDFLKLDVEGAEINVIRGAIKPIAQFKPRMAISIYHKFEDLFAIPLLVNKLDKDYKLYVGHHHPALYDTVLYAVP